MDSFELMTTVRNFTKKHTEKDIPTQELLRNLNLANSVTSLALYPMFKEDLVKSLTETSQTGDYALPKDLLLIVNAYRKNDASDFKLCNKLTIEDHPVIGTPPFPSDENYPIIVQVGTDLSFTPALSTTDIKLEYRKRIADLVFGIGTSAADGTYITLDNYAPVRDDVLNDYWLALYKNTSGDLRKETVIKITDYVAATKRAMCTTPDNDQEYTYALVPALPDEFHPFIIIQTLVYLALSDYYDKNPDTLQIKLDRSIGVTLQSHGFEYSPEVEGKS